jgi:CubicO group peptidase (beta-lactamase class C family)
MRCLIIILLALLFVGPLFGQLVLTEKQHQLLDSIATQDVPKNAPGIATAILQDGKIIYQKYAGYADLTDSTLIQADSRFNIASNGKQFTALAVLHLIDQKKLRLSDDIRKYFPPLFPKIKEKITVQALLNHTSGIRDCYDLWALQGYTWWKQTFGNADVLALVGQQADLNFAPNTGYLYSNTNYILLALLVEKVSGQGFVAYTNALFQQLGMPHTSFEDNYTAIKGSIARAYFNFGKWTTYKWIWNACGDGNLFSTLEDQLQWEKILQGRATAGIKRATLLKSQQPIAGATFKNYGYGLEFGQYKGMDYTFHEGATGAWKATVIRFPAQKMAMITLTNTGKSIPSMQTRQMADVVFGLKEDAKYWVTQPETIGKLVSEDDIVGTYLTADDFSFQFEKRSGKLFLKRIGRNDVELEREAANIFHQKYDPLFKQAFTTNDKGELQVTAYYTSHAPYSLTKQTADFSGVDFTKLAGQFVNAETNTTITVAYKADKTYTMVMASKDTATGFLITPTKLLVNNYTIQLAVTDAGIDTFYLNGGRIKRVRFVRRVAQ